MSNTSLMSERCAIPREGREIRVSRQDDRLFLRQSIDDGVVEVQVVLDDLFGSQG